MMLAQMPEREYRTKTPCTQPSFITAMDWDLRALQAVLPSEVTRASITLYSTKMRGGYTMRWPARSGTIVKRNRPRL